MDTRPHYRQQNLPLKAPRRKMNVLNRKQDYKLYDWLRGQKGANTLSELDREGIALLATQALGFTVTHVNLADPCQELGISNKGRRIDGPTNNKARTYKRRMLVIAKEIIRIQQALGMSVNPDIEYIANDSHHRVGEAYNTRSHDDE